MSDEKLRKEFEAIFERFEKQEERISELFNKIKKLEEEIG